MKLILLLSAFFLFSSASALGFGDIVSDPKSYSYYAQQLKETQEALDTAKTQLKTALETKDIARNTQKNLEGTYRRAQRAISDFKAMKEEMNKDSLAFAEKMIRDRRDVGEMRENTGKKVSKIFDPALRSVDEIKKSAGVDDNGKEWSPTWQGVKVAQKKIVRDELKKAVTNAEIVDALAANQLENIEDLAIKANSATSQKDATDVTNALLLQLIDQNQQMLKLVASISRNFAITNLSENNYESEDIYQSINKKMEEQEARKGTTKGYKWGGFLKDKLNSY